MYTIKKRNRIVLCLCSILVMFASIFAFIPLNKETKVVKADTVDTSYQFISSDTYHFDAYRAGSGNNSAIPVLFSARIVNDNGTLSFAPFFQYIFVQSWGNDTLRYYQCLYFQDHFNNTIYYFDNNNLLPLFNGITRYFVAYDELDLTTNFNYFIFDVFVSDNFNCNVYKVDIELVDDNFVNGDIENVSYLNFTYYDNNDNYLIFSFSVPSDFIYSSRTYYLISPNSFTDNQYYNEGYRQGLSEGLSSGKNEGFSSGYQVGKNDGYNLGYNTALENDKYTFTNLISAVIDVPVKAFTSLFNFEILGVNLSGFFLGLLTCCIVIGIIRLIL